MTLIESSTAGCAVSWSGVNTNHKLLDHSFHCCSGFQESQRYCGEFSLCGTALKQLSKWISC